MRLFVACDLSHHQKHELEVLQHQLAGCFSGVRWVQPQGLHLTLYFLGETEDDLLSQVKDSLHLACSNVNVFNLRLGGCGVFPDASRARVLWVGVKEGEEELKNLKTKIDLNLAGLGFVPEKRTYRPHLTLGRMRFPLAKENFMHFLSENKSFESSSVLIENLILFESRLNSRGAVYFPLEKFKLRNAAHKANSQQEIND
jgi:RNA 2',3'-cyclic 3'-phosphodiesterase